MKLLENIYHTDNATDEEIVSNFTIGVKEFGTIMKTIKEQGKKSLQHFLIIGKRGMGKSTLIRRLDIELKKECYANKIITIRLGGEGYRLSKLYKLWEQIIDILSLQEPALKILQSELEDSKAYEENIVTIIADFLLKQNKTILLLIDNFDTLVKNISTKEQHQLRETLIQYPIQIIGNTLFYGEQFFSYNQPFYDFFKVVKLKNLTKEESINFIESILEKEKKEGRFISEHKKLSTISTLRILSGGVPRTIIFLMSVLYDDSVESTMQHLKKLNELVTPLYQDRMNLLSPQQREIIWAMAMQWDKTGVREIAKRIRMESKNVSAQLKVLEENGYVAKADTPGRNNYYMIDERYFNIWLLMSEGTPYDGKKVLWLTRSLDMLLDKTEVRKYAKGCLGKIKEHENKLLLTQALLQSEHLNTYDKLTLLDDFSENTAKESSADKDWIISTKESLLTNTTENEVLYAEIEKEFKNKNYEEAIGILKKIKKNSPNKLSLGTNKKIPIDNTSNYVLNIDAKNKFENEQYEDAIAIYKKLASSGDKEANNIIGVCYQLGLNDVKNAEKYFLLAIENNDIAAIYNLALLYNEETKNYKEAEKYYLMAVVKKNISAMNNLGTLYADKLLDYTKAEKYYLMAIDKNHVLAMNNLALLYQRELKDYIKAEKYYLMAVENNDISAMNSLGILYVKNLNENKKAEKYFLRAIENNDIGAMNNIANLYSNRMNDYEKAKKYYLMAIKNKNIEALFNLGHLYDNKLGNKMEAEKYYLKAIQNNYNPAIYRLSTMYLMENKNREESLKLIEKYEELHVIYSTKFLKAVILLWNKKIVEANRILQDLITLTKEDLHKDYDFYGRTLFYVLIFKQKNMLYNFFSQNEFAKDIFKPIYFALLQEMKDEKEKEYLTMPPELEEPVNLLIEEIKNERIRYDV